MKLKSSMKRLLVLLLFLFTCQATMAGVQDFELFNRTGVDVYAVYISPSGEDEWEEDVLGADVLLQGADIEITFDRDEDAELWDIRIEDEDGDFLEWEEIDLYSAYQIILEPDGMARVKDVD